MDDPLAASRTRSGSFPDEKRTPQTPVSRRDLFRLTVGGGAGLALGGLLDPAAVRAATKDWKLSAVSELTTSCNFCSCGCGMIAAVRDGKLVAMEGDYDHIVNRGALCVKGISMFATHTSPKRLTTPLYRAPGSDRWEEKSWDWMLPRIAAAVKKTRDASFQTEAGGTVVNRTEAIASLGGAALDNEECYLLSKAMRALGIVYLEHQARI
jgi:formate dehydrogenase major subunit